MFVYDKEKLKSDIKSVSSFIGNNSLFFNLEYYNASCEYDGTIFKQIKIELKNSIFEKYYMGLDYITLPVYTHEVDIDKNNTSNIKYVIHDIIKNFNRNDYITIIFLYSINERTTTKFYVYYGIMYLKI